MEDRAKFRNRSTGRVGVIKIKATGERHAISVAPGEEVWLTQQEIIESAEAPRQAKDSPFEPRRVPVIDEETGQPAVNEDGSGIFREEPAPLEQLTEGRPVPTTRTIPSIPQVQSEAFSGPAPAAAAEGKNASGEELGTPAAKEIAQGGKTVKGAKGGDVFVPDGVVPGETPGWPVDDNGAPLELTDAQRKKAAKEALAPA
jgi:hypothetical protein